MPLIAETSPVNTPYFCHSICWKSIFAGAMAAAVTSIILFSLGSGIGLVLTSPFSPDSGTVAGFTIKIGLWMIAMQWLSGGFGGYLAGRLRKKHVDVPADEAYFRDTAHGFLTWAVATLLMAVLLTSAASSIIGGGVHSAAIVAAGPGKSMASRPDMLGQERGYQIDSLFRSTTPNANVASADANKEATRIIIRGVAAPSFPEEDKAYLAQLVSARTGISADEATARVNETISRVTAAKHEAIDAAEKARKASGTFSIFTALSMLVGAFIAAISAVVGARHRNFHPTM